MVAALRRAVKMPVMLAFAFAALALVQDPPTAGRFALDRVALASPLAVVSPLGWLEVTGRREGDQVVLKLRFPPLEWPAAGAQDIGEGAVRAWLGTTPGEDGDPLSGKLTVREFDHARVVFTLTTTQPQHDLEVDLPATMYVPKLAAAVIDPPAAADDEPDGEDVVFCALGNGGTGLPGQRAVADAIAALAPSGPLDFVLLLGNNFLPRGVASARDPLFRTRFEEVYDQRRLAVPFYVVQGPADHRGSFTAAADYGVMNSRWTCRPTGFGVEFACRGRKLGVFGADSPLLGGSIADSRTRTTLRGLFDTLRQSTADWKVVCTYEQLVPLGGRSEGPNIKVLEDRARANLAAAKVDLLLCADGRGLRLVTPEGGIPQLLSGGGGGPELGGVIEQVPGTRFAYGGGGFAWLRFDGAKLHISLRDAAGKVLYVHELEKQ